MATTPEAYVHLSTDKTTLTFYYDTLRADRKGIKCGIRNRKDYRDPSPLEWSDDDYDWRGAPHIYARTAVFDASFRDFRPTTTAGWFYKLYSLERIEGLEHLNTSQVTDMWSMFYGCGSLTSLDLTGFDTSLVTDMRRMFCDCASLTTIYCNSSWSARHSDDMFSGCNSLRAVAPNVGKGYDASMANPETGYFTKNVLPQEDGAYVQVSADKKTLTFYFDRERNVRSCCESLPSEVASKEEITQIVIDESYRNVVPKTTATWFEGFSAVTEIRGLENLNTSEVTDMSRMFAGCSALRSLDLSSFDTSKVTRMSEMFEYCESLISLDLSSFDTSKVTRMSEMFEYCESLISLDLSSFDTSQVTSMKSMFSGCWSLTSLDLTSFDTSQVRNMEEMFEYCESLTSLDLSSFDTSKVRYMGWMFFGCVSLIALDLSNFYTSQVTDMERMFLGCKSLTALDLSSFDTSKVRNMVEMFLICESLTTIYCNTSWSASRSDDMFSGCNSLRGVATNVGNRYDVSMANPETGYFTKKVLS